MKEAFTLLELLIVIAIIGILALVVITYSQQALDDARGAGVAQTKSQLIRAADLYWIDMGFYPPDVNRGWDPGFEQALPWNSDLVDGESVPSWAQTPDTDCSHCPADWQDIVARAWNGPYITWPDETRWGGEYDYNYWNATNTRPFDCDVSPGIYVGAEADYNDSSNSRIPESAESELIELGIDDDGCINQESQLLLRNL